MRGIREHAEGERLDTLDGVRITQADDRWCLVLPQDDEAVFMLYAEAPTPEEATALLDRWESVVEASL
jgi:mannose-1-phosphate guanylyltransferase/phosphomannomutase